MIEELELDSALSYKIAWIIESKVMDALAFSSEPDLFRKYSEPLNSIKKPIIRKMSTHLNFCASDICSYDLEVDQKRI